MDVTLRERDGRIALETPLGTLMLEGVTATRLSTAMEQLARWSVSKESGDPDRARVMVFTLIDPDPATELGGIAPPD